MCAWTWARAPWPDARGRRESCGLPATAPGGGPGLRLPAIQAREEDSRIWEEGKTNRKPWCVVRGIERNTHHATRFTFLLPLPLSATPALPHPSFGYLRVRCGLAIEEFDYDGLALRGEAVEGLPLGVSAGGVHQRCEGVGVEQGLQEGQGIGRFGEPRVLEEAVHCEIEDLDVFGICRAPSRQTGQHELPIGGCVAAYLIEQHLRPFGIRLQLNCYCDVGACF